MSKRNDRTSVSRLRRAAALATVIWLGVSAVAFGQPVCRPTLQFQDASFSEMDRLTLVRTWTARLKVDASRCATRAGHFEIGFAQLKETAPDIAFHQPFTWKPGSIEVSLEFAADEAVASYWLYTVAPCPCRD